MKRNTLIGVNAGLFLALAATAVLAAINTDDKPLPSAATREKPREVVPVAPPLSIASEPTHPELAAEELLKAEPTPQAKAARAAVCSTLAGSACADGTCGLGGQGFTPVQNFREREFRPLQRAAGAVLERRPLRRAAGAVLQRRPVRRALGRVFGRRRC